MNKCFFFWKWINIACDVYFMNSVNNRVKFIQGKTREEKNLIYFKCVYIEIIVVFNKHIIKQIKPENL